VVPARASLPWFASGRVPRAFSAWPRRRASPLPDVGGCRYGAGMPDQPDPGDGSPPPGRSPSGRKQTGGPPTPHDAVFRRIFGVPANAASQLRAVLPLGHRRPGWTWVGWRRCRAASSTRTYGGGTRDVLFTAPLDGRDAFVYVLVEHQSSDDPLMAFRMLRYVTRIWDQLPARAPLGPATAGGDPAGRPPRP
jgi:hypothetical protein